MPFFETTKLDDDETGTYMRAWILLLLATSIYWLTNTLSWNLSLNQ